MPVRGPERQYQPTGFESVWKRSSPLGRLGFSGLCIWPEDRWVINDGNS